MLATRQDAVDIARSLSSDFGNSAEVGSAHQITGEQAGRLASMFEYLACQWSAPRDVAAHRADAADASRGLAPIKLNPTIPGQMERAELEALCALAQEVPDHGIIVEVGSLCGLSAWHWSHNAKETVQVFCIDPWERQPWIVNLVEKPFGIGEFGKHIFDKHTADCKNVIGIRGYSPDVFARWTLPIRIFFDDAVHENPILRQNIDFWSQFVVPGGYVCGHDYTPQWPDVMKEAESLAARWNGELQVVGTFWWVKRPEA
ncbi:class I SAM-dependent methyltransferase [Methylobacterium sp. JK268]